MSPRTRKSVAADTSDTPKGKGQAKETTSAQIASAAPATGVIDINAGLISDITQRLVALEGASTDSLRLAEGYQTNARLTSAKVESLEKAADIASKKITGLAAQIPSASTLSSLSSDIAALRQKMFVAEAELVRHKAFHNAHDPEALAESARAETYKIWRVIAWGYPLLAALGAFALLRAI